MTPESREHRRWRITMEAARQLGTDNGLDGYAALAVVLDVDQRSRADWQLGRTHPWALEVTGACLAAIARTSGLDVAQHRLAANISRANRAVAGFKSPVAATCVEMDDEFRRHPDIAALDEHLGRFYE